MISLPLKDPTDLHLQDVLCSFVCFAHSLKSPLQDVVTIKSSQGEQHKEDTLDLAPAETQHVRKSHYKAVVDNTTWSHACKLLIVNKRYAAHS